MPEKLRCGAASLFFSVSIPRDDRFVAALHDLAVRIAEHVGFASADASDIGLAIDEGVSDAFQHAGSGLVSGLVDVTFCTRDGMLEVSLHYAEAGDPRPAPGAGRGAPHARVRHRVMDALEFESSGPGCVCRMARRIPPAPRRAGRSPES